MLWLSPFALALASEFSRFSLHAMTAGSGKADGTTDAPLDVQSPSSSVLHVVKAGQCCSTHDDCAFLHLDWSILLCWTGPQGVETLQTWSGLRRSSRRRPAFERARASAKRRDTRR